MYRLCDMKLMDDLLGDFLHGAQLSVHEHIGLAVSRFARGQQNADFRERIGIVEQGSM